MFLAMVILFVLGYFFIALEHTVKIDKAATALLLGVVLWSVYVLNGFDILGQGFSEAWTKHGGGNLEHVVEFIKGDLEHHLIEISEILFFLLSAMTIVEVVDRHGGFKIITNLIKTTKKVKLLWIFSILTFFMSSVLDNLTTTIVMLALLRKLVGDKKERWFFASMVVLASNAGGAWSPIGDVTTIMFMDGEQTFAGAMY
ncbi:MAG: sodium:proton antiporter NhaD [Bacteroidales bacterium]|nr:sodium:proton antiporter NhaD [Bacteroidales bacterium]